MSRLSMLGPLVINTALGGGENGSATGSLKANNIIFGPDMTLTGTSIGQTYLGATRMNPIAGSKRSLQKMLRRELRNLSNNHQFDKQQLDDMSMVDWWDDDWYGLVFCSFSRTLTAVWYGWMMESGTHITDTELENDLKNAAYRDKVVALKYRFATSDHVGKKDFKSHIFLSLKKSKNLYKAVRQVRRHHHSDFVEHELGFVNAYPYNNNNNNNNNKSESENIKHVNQKRFIEEFLFGVEEEEEEEKETVNKSTNEPTVVLDAICIRAWMTEQIKIKIRKKIENLQSHLRSLHQLKKSNSEDYEEEAKNNNNNNNNNNSYDDAESCAESMLDKWRHECIKIESFVYRLEHLDFMLQLWCDQMLDLSFWMQNKPAVYKRGYTDDEDLRCFATLMLYPHKRRFVSIFDLPDLVPWVPLTSACQEYDYWSPGGGASGLSMPATTILDGASNRGSVEKSTVAANANFPNINISQLTSSPSEEESKEEKEEEEEEKEGNRSPTTHENSDQQKPSNGNNNEEEQNDTPTSSTSSGGPSVSASHRGIVALAHMVLNKSAPHPCKIRNLNEIAVRKALEDPPVGLAIMDIIHILFLGNYPGCLHRPSFAIRSRIRMQSIVFRGATAEETGRWISKNYRLLHLAFKLWYLQVLEYSPAFKAAVSHVQRHAEYEGHVYNSVAQIHNLLNLHSPPNLDLFYCSARWEELGEDGFLNSSSLPKKYPPSAPPDFITLPPDYLLNDAAHMSHGEAAPALNKLRKGTFSTTLHTRLKSWLRGLCTEKKAVGANAEAKTVSQQYKEEIAQMMVISKIIHTHPRFAKTQVEKILQQKSTLSSEGSSSSSSSWRKGIPGKLDPIEPWCLGAPLTPLPVPLIHSFLKLEGDSELQTACWFGDRSFFLQEPYRFLDDLDMLYAIDLAAWMCARRTDGRFMISWLRFPIGLSAMAYQRLRVLYFNYECCDDLDNAFFIQVRRMLFRRRRRVISAEEYDQRVNEKDASIIHRYTEAIKVVVRKKKNVGNQLGSVEFEADDDDSSSSR